MSWTRTGETVKRADRRTYERCVCACGHESWVKRLRGGSLATSSCKACANKTGRWNLRHGHAHDGGATSSLTYKTWNAIKIRCTYPSVAGYENYGGRGIIVCERWLGEHGFENFLADMGERPSKGHSIDRFPNKDGNYEPGNCRWATRKEQQRNRADNTNLTAFGETMTLVEWSERVGIEADTIGRRLERGWDVERALTERVQVEKHRHSTADKRVTKPPT
jgi:hypothetical protein